MKTLNAIRKCANWLSYCLEIGYKKSDINGLESLWWRFHDDNGNLIKSNNQ